MECIGSNCNMQSVGRMFGSKRDDRKWGWSIAHNEETNDLYCSPNILRVIKKRRIRWAGHVARLGRRKAYTELWRGNLKERNHLGGPGVDGRIILGWIFRKWDVGIWTGLGWPRIETGGGRL